MSYDIGIELLVAKLRSDDGPYFRLPRPLDPAEITRVWLRALDQHLRHIRERSLQFQQELV